MSDLSDLAVACNKILALEKAIGENRFLRTLPFRQIKTATQNQTNMTVGEGLAPPENKRKIFRLY